MVKNPPASAGDASSIPVSETSPGEGNDNPLQYSCLGNPMDRGTWYAVVYGVTKSPTYLATIKADQEEAAWQWRADFLPPPVFILFLELVPQLGNGSKSSAYENMNPSALTGTTMHFSEMILAGHGDLC